MSEALRSIVKEDSIFLGGGTATALLYKTRLIEPSRVVWLGRISELGAIERDEESLRIGAMSTMASIASSREVISLFPGVARASGVIGNARVRAMATLGGGLAHADPRQDVPPALIAVDAKVLIRSSSRTREVSLADFYQGFLETVLESDELITQVVIPIIETRRSAYLRYTPTTEGDYPTVGVGASLDFGSDGKTIVGARIALCGVGQVPIIAMEAANSLVGKKAGEESFEAAGSLAQQVVLPHDDERGSAAYKKEMSKVMVSRTLGECLAGP